MLIYIIRHGETDANVEGRLQGHTDFDINERGIEMAVQTGIALKDIDFDVAYCSPLMRARHTAEIVLDHSDNADVELISDERITEIDMGDWELKRFKGEASELSEAETDMLFNDLFGLGSFPGGESLVSLCERCQAFLRDIATRDYEKVLIIAHAFGVRGMLNFLYDDPTDFWHHAGPKNCVMNVVEAKDGEFKIIQDDVALV